MRAADAIKNMILDALKEWKLPASQIENQLAPGQLPPTGNTGSGYTPAHADHTRITDWQEAVEDVIGAAVEAGTNITVAYNDTTGKTTVSATATGDLTYRHVQSSPASTWVVVHNLGKYAAVSVVDSSGDLVVGDVHYDSTDQITITFSAAFGGEAYIN